ncbi:hypothetical protein MmiHf6_00830 [Methanimicrococcus hongohii]|uniref:Uncharacterized protein n=1 Tax=Methanimicrococcus hongohii TaxID=3028295 RepID=A0AA96UZ87_9EURY|nr:hypothetical protein [Methanimicrococcus sp. Hf6]WNY22798.1 hypothetical protein MmiHf6_00830 [Methanimicrococcus sp. Hf6]
MSVYEQLQTLQSEFEKYRDSSTGKPSFFYFVEHCGKVKAITDKFFEEISEMEPVETPIEGNNLITVQLIRGVARKTMAEQKLIAKASELPISKAWTANGITETIIRIKKLEQKAAAKAEKLAKNESMMATAVTIGNYKTIRKILVESLKEKMKNPKATIDSVIPVKYRLFIGKEDIQTADMILNFIVPDMKEKNIEEIENMNYISFKYSVLMMITALRLTYEFPQNYEIYRFCSALPKNPNENSELIQKLEEMIIFTDNKMSNVMRLAKTYDKFEQYEAKVLGGKD